MKRRYLVAAMIAALLFSGIAVVSADEYQTYQEIVFVEDGHLLLADFEAADYGDAYACLGGRRMIGWKLFLVTRQEEVDFLSETKLKIYNNGFSSIRHDITLTTKVETRFQISASGSIGVKISGDVKKFDGAIDGVIKTEIGYVQTTTLSELYEFSIIVDPGTYVSIVMRGKGVVSNGVARNYLFWILTKEGGWETLTVTTEYYEIIKDRIG